MITSREKIDKELERLFPSLRRRELARRFLKVEEVLGILEEVRENTLGRNITGNDFYSVLREKYGFHVRVNDTIKNVPEQGSVIIAANHPYPMGDGLAIQYLAEKRRTSGPVKFVSDSTIGLIDELLDLCIQAPDPRSKSDRDRYRGEVREHFKNDGLLTIFPRGRGVIEGPWKNGALRMAQKYGVPVVPAKIIGSKTTPAHRLIHKLSKTLGYKDVAGYTNPGQLIRPGVTLEPIFGEEISDISTIGIQKLKRIVYALKK